MFSQNSVKLSNISIKMVFNDELAENFNIKVNNHLLYRQCLNYFIHRRNILLNLMKDVDNVEDINFKHFKNPYLMISLCRDIYLDREIHKNLLSYLKSIIQNGHNIKL